MYRAQCSVLHIDDALPHSSMLNFVSGSGGVVGHVGGVGGHVGGHGGAVTPALASQLHSAGVDSSGRKRVAPPAPVVDPRGGQASGATQAAAASATK